MRRRREKNENYNMLLYFCGLKHTIPCCAPQVRKFLKFALFMVILPIAQAKIWILEIKRGGSFAFCPPGKATADKEGGVLCPFARWANGNPNLGGVP